MLFALSLLSGAGVFGKADLTKANLDWYAVITCLVFSLLFPPLLLWHAHSGKLTPILAPSFGRMVSGGWRRDPLQWTRITGMLFLGSFIGNMLTLDGETSGQPLMVTCTMASFAIGSCIGELICRRAFARFISV